jgi:hypothetical protein
LVVRDRKPAGTDLSRIANLAFDVFDVSELCAAAQRMHCPLGIS